MKTKTIRQNISFATTPEKLYALLLDSKKMTRIHGSPASFSKRAKGKFSVFGGYCHGYNIELTSGRWIVQAWHFNEEGWPEDYYSTCSFLLEKKPKGTKLVFSQQGVPAHSYASLKDGWHEYYWNPIREFLENS